MRNSSLFLLETVSDSEANVVLAQDLTSVAGYYQATANGMFNVMTLDADVTSGELKTTFQGSSQGLYNIFVDTWDENDGVAMMEILVNDNVVQSQRFDQDYGYNGINNSNRITVIATDVLLKPQDSIQIKGYIDQGEFVRVFRLVYVRSSSKGGDGGGGGGGGAEQPTSAPAGDEEEEETPRSFPLSGGIGDPDEGLSFGDGSGCTIQYKQFPWSVRCDITLLISTGLSNVNNGEPEAVRATAGVIIDATSLADPSAAFKYSTTIQPVSFAGNTVDKVAIDEISLKLDKSALDLGLCLSTIPSSVLGAVPTIGLAQTAIGVIGADVCALAPGLTFSSSDSDDVLVLDGGAVKLLIDITLFDPDKAGGFVSETAIESLGLESPISVSLDVGQVVADGVFGSSGSRLRFLEDQESGGEDNPIAKDGRFLFGESAKNNEATPTSGSTGRSRSAIGFFLSSTIFLFGVVVLG